MQPKPVHTHSQYNRYMKRYDFVDRVKLGALENVCFIYYLVGRLWIVGVLVGMQLQSHLSVGLFDLVGRCGLWQTEQLVQGVAGSAVRENNQQLFIIDISD